MLGGSASLATQESVQLQLSLHTKPFVHPPSRLPSPRQAQRCLVEGQLISWAVSGGEDDDGSSGNPTTLKCYQVTHGKAQAGQRELVLPTGKEGNPGVRDGGILPLPNHNYHCYLGLFVLHGSQSIALTVNSKQTAITRHTNSP